MTAREFFSHALTVTSVVAGILGFGLIYQGLTGGGAALLVGGVPVLLIGLWWSGLQLGRSNLAARRRRALRRAQPNVVGD